MKHRFIIIIIAIGLAIPVLSLSVVKGKIAGRIYSSIKNTISNTSVNSSLPKSDNVRSQDNSQQTLSEKLTGRAIESDNAVKSANSIVQGKLLSLGTPQPGAPGQIYYENAEIEIMQVLKGEASQLAIINISFTVQKMPPTELEEAPEVGQAYLFLLKKNGPQHMRGIKILSATPENINLVTNLITK